MKKLLSMAFALGTLLYAAEGIAGTPSTKPDKNTEIFCQDSCTSASCTDPTFHEICTKKCPADAPGSIGAANRACERGWKAKTEGSLKDQKVKNKKGEMVDVKLSGWGDGNAIRSACSKSAKCKDSPDLKAICQTAFSKLPLDEAEKVAQYMATDCLPGEAAQKLADQKKAAAQKPAAQKSVGLGEESEGPYTGNQFCLDCDAGTCKVEAWGELCAKKCRKDLINVCLKSLEQTKESGALALPAYQRVLSGKCDSKTCKDPDVKAACQATHEELKEYAEDKNVAKALKEWDSKMPKCLGAK